MHLKPKKTYRLSVEESLRDKARLKLNLTFELIEYLEITLKDSKLLIEHSYKNYPEKLVGINDTGIAIGAEDKCHFNLHFIPFSSIQNIMIRSMT